MEALLDDIFWYAAGLHMPKPPTLFRPVAVNRILCLEPATIQEDMLCLKWLFTRLGLLLRVSRAYNEKTMAFATQYIYQTEQSFVTLKLNIENEQYLGLYATCNFKLIAITKEKMFTPTVVDILSELVHAESICRMTLTSASFQNAVMQTRSRKQCRRHERCCYCELHNMNLLRPDWSTYELRFQESLVSAMFELGFPLETIVKISQTERMFNEYDKIAEGSFD